MSIFILSFSLICYLVTSLYCCNKAKKFIREQIKLVKIYNDHKIKIEFFRLVSILSRLDLIKLDWRLKRPDFLLLVFEIRHHEVFSHY